ncbi:MAG: hypothetical protein IH591_00880 [Bacteroidales bacterium]|nr:hypothetical protein [Bacteroidales bacterium]
MTKHIIPSLLLVSLIMTVATLSCAPESCYEDTTSAAMAGFYETGTGINISPDSVTVFGAGSVNDTLWFSQKNIKSVNIYLDPSSPSCSYVFIINGIQDTITFNYSSFPHLISKECGYSMFHTVETCTSTKNIIDTVIIRNRNITIPYEENIRIFF